MANTDLANTWALHNPMKNWIMYNLTQAEVGLLIFSLSEAEKKTIRINQKNDKTWQVVSVDLFPQFFNTSELQSYLVNDNFAPIVSVQTEESDKYFVIKPSKKLHPRLHQRFEVNIACVILGNNDKNFETATIDLSEGGLYFQDLIPTWVAGYFLVTVDNKFQLMCSLVEDQKEKKRVQIVSEENDFNFIQYKNWLAQL